ncbi:MAG: hypothetical protein IPK75_20075 [Acidobacteria bacterium]|nr:hypothetical protein [Acidobacteriota bacterium]
MNIDEAAKATRRWLCGYEYRCGRDGIVGGWFTRRIVESDDGVRFPSREEAQAACDRLNLAAVLRAIREPSEAMVTEAERAHGLWRVLSQKTGGAP